MHSFSHAVVVVHNYYVCSFCALDLCVCEVNFLQFQLPKILIIFIIRIDCKLENLSKKNKNLRVAKNNKC